MKITHITQELWHLASFKQTELQSIIAYLITTTQNAKTTCKQIRINPIWVINEEWIKLKKILKDRIY